MPVETAKPTDEVKKMGPFKTFMAMCKAYCAINVLLLPKSFTKGGYVVSPAAMAIGCFFETLSAVKLAQIAVKYELFTYPAIADRALGNAGKNLVRCLIALASF